jgi:hypothetical protein
LEIDPRKNLNIKKKNQNNKKFFDNDITLVKQVNF